MIPYARAEGRGKKQGPAATNKYEGEQGKRDEHEEDRKRQKKREKWGRGEIGGSGFKSLLKRWIDVPTNGSCLPRLLSSSRFFFFFLFSFYRSCSFNTGLIGLLSSVGIGRLPCSRDWSKLTRWNNEWITLSRRAREHDTRYLYTCHRATLWIWYLSVPRFSSRSPEIKSNRVKDKFAAEVRRRSDRFIDARWLMLPYYPPYALCALQLFLYLIYNRQ